MIWHTHTHTQSGTCTRSTPCRRVLTLSTSAKRICRARDSTTTSASTANCARASAAISKSSFTFLYTRKQLPFSFLFFFCCCFLVCYIVPSIAISVVLRLICINVLYNLHHLLPTRSLLFLRRETCYNAWRGLRMTPLFGCFCPGNDQKKCERIYSFIYNNTCVGKSILLLFYFILFGGFVFCFFCFFVLFYYTLFTASFDCWIVYVAVECLYCSFDCRLSLYTYTYTLRFSLTLSFEIKTTNNCVVLLAARGKKGAHFQIILTLSLITNDATLYLL